MKYVFLIFIVTGLSPFLTGCAEFSNLYKNSQAKKERLASIENKIQELEQELSALNTTDKNLTNRVEELSQKTNAMDTNYSKLSETVYSLNSKFEKKDQSIENNLVETQKNIDGLENRLNRLNEIEKIKTDLQNQIIVLLAQKSNITNSEVGKVRDAMKEEVEDVISQKNEAAQVTHELPDEKESEEEPDKSLAKQELQNMMDEALALYRDGKYRDSLRKWKEVLSVDPGNLEAKFNIGIIEEKSRSLSERYR